MQWDLLRSPQDRRQNKRAVSTQCLLALSVTKERGEGSPFKYCAESWRFNKTSPSYRLTSRRWNGLKMGGRFWHPAGVRFVFDGVPGVSLALNPRLMSGSPPGCRDTRTAPKDLATAESWRAG